MPVRSKQTKTQAVKHKPIKFSGYKSYGFDGDHDPILDKLATVMEDGNLSWTEVHEKSGVSPQTILNYVYRLTRRPRFATLAAVFAIYGYDLTPTKRVAEVIPIRRGSRRS